MLDIKSLPKIKKLSIFFTKDVYFAIIFKIA
nr:MAG TPA: hypothetical protein [Caudoviricetes sp.]